MKKKALIAICIVSGIGIGILFTLFFTGKVRFGSKINPHIIKEFEGLKIGMSKKEIANALGVKHHNISEGNNYLSEIDNDKYRHLANSAVIYVRNDKLINCYVSFERKRDLSVYESKTLDGLKAGMERDEVIEILGKPDRSRLGTIVCYSVDKNHEVTIFFDHRLLTLGAMFLSEKDDW